jgi:hypothetical protein
VKFPINRTYNQPDRVTGIRPNPQLLQGYYLDNSQLSQYHSSQTSLQKRFAHNLTFAARYTWGKQLANDSGDIGAYYQNDGNVRAQDFFDLRREWGPADGDTRHYFSGDWVYALPNLKSMHSAVVRQIFGGWQTSGIVAAATGTPLLISLGNIENTSRPDYVGGNPVNPDYQKTLQYLNKSAFATPPIGAASGLPIRPGNLGHGAVFGPGYWNVDLSLGKNFRLVEKVQLQVRMDAFNAFNHTSLRVFYRRQQFELRQVHEHKGRARFAVERAAELVREAMNRRRFLKQTGAAAGLTAVQGLTGAEQAVSIIVDRNDPVASTAPVSWAVGEFQAVLKAQGVASGVYPRIGDAPSGARYVMIAGNANSAAREVLRRAPATTLPSAAEALWTVPGALAGKPVLLAGANDARGLVYAVLDLADRVRYSPAALPALDLRAPVIEKPANVIRSCARCFVTPIEDKAWFYDRAMWKEYLSNLASQRFNRFNLTLGIGYNSARNIPDSYFYFAYPFLFAVPGYDVKATGLPDAERDRNLEMLKFISEETVARGIQFNLALWSHAYEWPNPDTNYRIPGLTPQTHAPIAGMRSHSSSSRFRTLPA